MATIYNSDLSKELRDGAKIEQSRDKVPNQLAEKVVPVMEVNPKLLRAVDTIAFAGRGTTGNNTAYTTPTGKDFYLTGFTASYAKDAVCDIATGEIIVYSTVGGVLTGLSAFSVITLTAQENTVSVSFSTPIKLDRNVPVYMSGAFAAGVLRRSLCIQGYTVED